MKNDQIIYMVNIILDYHIGVPLHSCSCNAFMSSIKQIDYLYVRKRRMFAYFSTEVTHEYLMAVWHPIHPAITVLCMDVDCGGGKSDAKSAYA